MKVFSVFKIVNELLIYCSPEKINLFKHYDPILGVHSLQHFTPTKSILSEQKS